MTAFSLFHQPTVRENLLAIRSSIERKALLSSIFSLSARFTKLPALGKSAPCDIPSPDTFLDIANDAIDEAVKHYPDEPPTLHLLQAMILTTFHRLIGGVNGRAWRDVGTCVRIAYEMQLHLIDRDPPIGDFDALNLVQIEERRRAWWAIWELDVFASTIRRVPTAIDWTNNATCLPIDDQEWFEQGNGKSCRLNPDPEMAWKDLEKSGNQNPKAWLLVMTALMVCAHKGIYSTSYSNKDLGSREYLAQVELNNKASNIFSNTLYCLISALPRSVTYHGEQLSFSTSDTSSSVQEDCHKYSMALIIQLSRYTIYHRQILSSTWKKLASSSYATADGDNSTRIELSLAESAAWNVYLTSTSEIMTLIRSCPPWHISYISPFLVHVIYIAAASQFIAPTANPSRIRIDHRLATPNLDTLYNNIKAYETFWGVSSKPLQKLRKLEQKLPGSKGHESRADVTIPRRERYEPPLDIANLKVPTDVRDMVSHHSPGTAKFSVPLGVFTPDSGGPWNFLSWRPPCSFVDHGSDAPSFGSRRPCLSDAEIEQLLSYGGIV
jgi:hypothetical protein